MTGAFERRLWEINSTQNAACAGDIAADVQPIINAQSGVFEGVDALVR
ncbi:hypothetical protein [Boseongicola aestuarii]|uniref:EAL domain-containing protein n=1 Tax=Boseongicola aestuarii TaxID=1470561 RepID=A0A238J2S2_9RHOB|nr:hypothetical protein [Boseongicola aestuarii]SMX24621.1 hypothetical protein BOA8489_02747 [Boseongicola aestuarii]